MKGNADIFYFPIVLFTSALIIILGFYLLSYLNTNTMLGSATSAAVLESWLMWDKVYIIMVVGLAIIAMILAYFTPTSPIFFGVEIILIIFAVFFSPIYSNMYAEIANNPLLNPSANQYPQIAFILGNMPVITLFVSISVAVISYGKKNYGQGGISGL